MVKKALVVCHKDADGILSASLTLLYLHQKGIEADVACTSHLLVEKLKQKITSHYDKYYFLDIGSQKEILISKTFHNSVIIDHHPPGLKDISALKNVKIINAYLEGLDGSKEITATGMVFYNFYNPHFHQYFYIPAVSAFADSQPFIGPNKRFLNNAILRNQIKEETGINLFGYSLKPISKNLEYFFDEIGADENATYILKKLHIPPNKTIKDLTKGEEIKLATYLAMKGYLSQIIDKRYLIKSTYELKEYTSLINAAVKLDEIKKAINFILKEKGNLYELYEIYRRKLRKYVKKALNTAEEKGKAVIVNIPMEENAITGTIATILSQKHYLGKIVCVCTPYEDNYIKFSLRYAGEEKLDLGKKVRELKADLNIDGSGHKKAAGGIVHQEDLEKFTNALSL
ncbi:MAG: DHH family phosphoesterase [Candidatus Nanohaloarchaeota archaeon]|nr:DHH family phosphoesterase [Candidatus Nanohaloarchaeota archaeon]